jgi:Ni,Fe-hydrogenase I cytochrome b subunit
MYHQVQHSKIPNVARFALSILYGSQNRQRTLLYTSLTDWFFLIIVVESVYSAVRTDSLYKVDYVSSLKG